jgi:hypothetical protein
VHLPLALTDDARLALGLAAQGLHARGAWARCDGLPAHDLGAARLVELSAMVALPGAGAQHPHTDVPPHSRRRLVTLWVALQDVDATMGPTAIFPVREPRRALVLFCCLLWLIRDPGGEKVGSLGPCAADPWPEEGYVPLADRCWLQQQVAPADLVARVDWAAVLRSSRTGAGQTSRSRQVTYSADGEYVTCHDDHRDFDHRDGDHGPGARADTRPPGAPPGSVAELGLPDPVAVEMGSGGAALMDCRAFHFGAANTSAIPRALLSATFESPAAAGTPSACTGPALGATSGGLLDEEGDPSGFTYEIRGDLAGRYSLADFVRTSCVHVGNSSH